MKFKNLIILVVVFILLGGYVYIVEIKQHEKEQKKEEQAQQLFHFEKDSVESLLIHNTNGDFKIDQIQNEWRIVQPVETGADENTIEIMLNGLLNAKKVNDFLVNPGELPNYGITDAAVKVQVNLKNGETESLQFGDKTPVGNNVFTSRTDTLVYTIPQSIKTNFEKKLFDLRNKDLLKFQRNMVKRIVIYNQYGEFKFEQSGAGKWQIKDIDRPADSGILGGLLTKLVNNKAKAFVDESGEQVRKYGLANPAYRVDLFLGPEQGKKSLMVSGKMNGKFYARDDSRNPIFEVDSTLITDLNKNLSGYRSDDFATFDKNSVDRFEIQYGDTAIAAVKDTTGGWFTDDPAHQKLKQSEISSFFSDIDFTTISGFVTDGNYNPLRYGLKNPQLKIALYEGDQLKFEAEFGSQKGDNVYAVTSEYQSVYLIPASRLVKFKLKLADLLESPALPDTLQAGED